MSGSDKSDHEEQLGELLDTPNLTDALESENFRQFLDHLPIAIAVSRMQPREHIVYANPVFLDLTGLSAQALTGKDWTAVPGVGQGGDFERLAEAITARGDFLGAFAIPGDTSDSRTVDAWAALIEDEDGAATFRLLALIQAGAVREGGRETLEREIRERDTLLRELQHRVKNNLQMITALIRMEARHAADTGSKAGFVRLAGRVEALALLYQTMSHDAQPEEIDLGSYLSQIASAVMTAQATEGVRLELTVDAWLVSINVAMPVGLVVNELMTNALKYAFPERNTGVIRLQCTVGEEGCVVVVADDGVGMPSGGVWPKPGKLSALIVRSLCDNARARLEVDSKPGQGTVVTIRFSKEAASA